MTSQTNYTRAQNALLRKGVTRRSQVHDMFDKADGVRGVKGIARVYAHCIKLAMQGVVPWEHVFPKIENDWQPEAEQAPAAAVEA